MLKDFKSEYDRRDFIQKLFRMDMISDKIKLEVYLKILSLGVESCFIKPNRDYDENFRTIAYLKPGKRFNKVVFRESKELAIIFSVFVPHLANKRQKGIDAKRKTIAKTIMLNGLVSENYEQVIDYTSNKRGIEEIVKYLMRSENYGTILKLFEEKIFQVNVSNYQLIINTVITEIKNRKKGYDTRYNDDKVKYFLTKLQNILDINLNVHNDKIKYIK